MRVKDHRKFSINGKRRPPNAYIFIGDGMISYTWRETIDGCYTKIAAIFASESEGNEWLNNGGYDFVSDGYSKEIKHICRSVYGVPVLDHFTRKPIIDLYTGKPNDSLMVRLDNAIGSNKAKAMKDSIDRIKRRIRDTEFRIKWDQRGIDKDCLLDEIHSLKRELDECKDDLAQAKIEKLASIVDKKVNLHKITKPKTWEEMTHRERVESKLLHGEEYDPDIDG